VCVSCYISDSPPEKTRGFLTLVYTCESNAHHKRLVLVRDVVRLRIPYARKLESSGPYAKWALLCLVLFVTTPCYTFRKGTTHLL
jgi:hypothetical protein